MSKYTTEVRFICETAAGYEDSQGYEKVDDIIANSLDKVFDFDFPIFDENYRSVLETKILKHYYTREIGFETVGLWKHFMAVRLNEIMPKYNKLYKAESLGLDPFGNIDYTEQYEGEGSGTNSNTNSGSISEDITDSRDSERDWDDTSMDKFSDTPQGAVTNLDNGTYLTNARQIARSGNDDVDEDYTRDRDVITSNSNNGRFSNTDEYLKHFKGYNGSRTFSELFMTFKETFMNVDLMVIEELNDLFMGVW